MSKYDELLIRLWDLDEWVSKIKDELIDYEVNFKPIYKAKYIDLLFNFYSSANEFSQITSEVCDTREDGDLLQLTIDYQDFIRQYSRLLQFFKFANVKEPDGFWLVFNEWKNRILDMTEYEIEEYE